MRRGHGVRVTLPTDNEKDSIRTESRLGGRPGTVARIAAAGLPIRLAAPMAGLLAARLTGRVTVWARKPC